MRWYYFEIKGDSVSLVDDDYFQARPSDANDCGGNPHTPWYQVDDHWDENHIHIRAANAQQALIKASLVRLTFQQLFK